MDSAEWGVGHQANPPRRTEQEEQLHQQRVSKTVRKRTADYVTQQSAIQQYTTEQYQHQVAQQQDMRQWYEQDMAVRQAQYQQWWQYQNNQIAMFRA